MDIQQIKPATSVVPPNNTALGTLPKTSSGMDVASASTSLSAPSTDVSANVVKAVPSAVDATQLKQALDKVNAVVQKIAPELSFSIDKDTGIRVVKVVDLSTNDVIRQFPSEEVLNIAKSLDKLQGLLVKQTV